MAGVRAAVVVAVGAVVVLLHYLPFLPGQSIPGTAFLGQCAQLAGFASVLLVPLGVLLLLWRGLRLSRRPAASTERWWLVPSALVLVPLLVVGALLGWSSAAADVARDRAIGQATELIAEIETAQQRTGSYPESLLALNPDIVPGVVGIDRFQYERLGDGYQLVFENPRYLPFGTRELVVYNPHGEQIAVSHALWRLNAPSLRGWYMSGPASTPHWRWFFFD